MFCAKAKIRGCSLRRLLKVMFCAEGTIHSAAVLYVESGMWYFARKCRSILQPFFTYCPESYVLRKNKDDQRFIPQLFFAENIESDVLRKSKDPFCSHSLRRVLHLHLFTQTDENIRTITQYCCHFRRRMFNVVGYYSVCSTTSAPPPPTFFTFRMFFSFPSFSSILWSMRSILTLSGT